MTYELMIVATVKGASELLSRVEKSLKDIKAENVKVDKLGKKQLGFAIKKQTEAEYFVLNFGCEPVHVKTISDMLRLEQDDLLRYLFIKSEVSKKRKARKTVEKEEPKAEEKPKVTVVTKTVEKVAKVAEEPKVIEKKSTKVKKETKSKKVAKAKKDKKV